MQAFENFINTINNYIWSTALIVVLVAVGLYFTIMTKGIQFRRFGDMFRSMKEKDLDGKNVSLSPYEAFATTVGTRVGTGNIAGVATAIFFGGPGAVVWMWLIALIGAATAVIESLLGQAYKDELGGELVGSPAYYMQRGLKARWLGILFALATIIGPAFLMASMQSYTTCSALNGALHIPMMAIAVVLTVLTALVVLGGIKRIGEVASFISPIMCALYLIIGLVIFVANIGKVPETVALMFRCAFGADAAFGGIIGSMISWGIKRGVYSNDAGDGMGPILSSTAETSHPVKQGLVQGLSVYVDTILVCSITAFSILLSGTYNVSDGAEGFIVNGAPDIEYGVLYMEEAASKVFGGHSIGAILIAIILATFVFSTLISYSYQLESSCKFIFGNNRVIITIGRILFLFCVLTGGFISGAAIWAMADTGAGMMAWLNIVAIVLLSPMAFKIVKDYDKQKKAGLDPMFDPATVGIDDPNGVWDHYVEKKKARGDYENPALGYDIKK